MEELGELDHLPFDLLDIFVALRNVSCDGLCLATAIALNQSRAEDLLIVWILHSFTHFSIRGVGANDSVLSRHLLLRCLSELPLDLLVLVDGSFQSSINLSDLRRITWVTRLWLLLDILDTADETSVLGHDVFAGSVDFDAQGRLSRGVCVSKVTRLETLQTLQVCLDLVNGLVDSSAFIEDSVGVISVHISHLFGMAGQPDSICGCSEDGFTISASSLLFISVVVPSLWLRWRLWSVTVTWLIVVSLAIVVAPLRIWVARLSIGIVVAIALAALLAVTLIVLARLLVGYRRSCRLVVFNGHVSGGDDGFRQPEGG